MILRTLYFLRIARQRMGRTIAVPVGRNCSICGLVREATLMGLTIETADGHFSSWPWANINHLTFNNRMDGEFAKAVAEHEEEADEPRPALSQEEIAAMLSKADEVAAEIAVRR